MADPFNTSRGKQSPLYWLVYLYIPCQFFTKQRGYNNAHHFMYAKQHVCALWCTSLVWKKVVKYLFHLQQQLTTVWQVIMRLIKKIINRGVIIFKKISIGDSLAITPIMVSNNSYSPDSKTVAGCEGGNGSGELSPRWCSTVY